MCTEKFKKMALSFSGCDGGNLNSDIWICGLERGFHGDMKDGELKDECLAPKLESGGWNDTLEKHNRDGWVWEDSFKSPANKKMGWFLDYYFGLGGFPSTNEDKNDWIVKNKIFFNEPNGIGFKMNMLPIPFRGRNDLNWSSEITQKTGFDSFDEYREWTVQNRGVFFQKLLHKYKPRFVICIGVSELGNFYKFWGVDSYEEKEDTEKNTSFFIGEKEGTRIIVTRFFGARPSLINTLERMERLVQRIKEFREKPL